MGLGAIAGIVAGVAGFTSLDTSSPNPNAYYGFYIAFFVYIASYYLAKYPLGLSIMQKDRTKMITQGIGSYIMMFLFLWIVYNTLLYLKIF